jgi:tRNA G10  N-methylase Trm11
LIEALNSGYSNVYGSDLNEKMVEATQKNISFYLKETTKAEVFKQDSSLIEKVDFLK